jgi:hypothetical protein
VSNPSASAILLSDFRKLAEGLSREAFLQRYPHPVLVFEMKTGDFGEPGFQTVSTLPKEHQPPSGPKDVAHDPNDIHDEDGIPEEAATTDLDILLKHPPSTGPVAERHADIAKRLDQADSALFFLPLVKRDVNKFASMITLGRSASNDVRINLPSVSKFHAYFTFVPRDNTWWLADANSSNGTFVNGERLRPEKGRTKLEAGNAIRIGPDVTARFFDAGSFQNFLTVK